MIEREFYNRATNSKKDVVAQFLTVLSTEGIPYCVIGGVAVNAYTEPVVTLDLDCVVDAGQIEKVKAEMRKRGLKVKSHPHTWEVTHKDSDVRIQLQRDRRYQDFLERARKLAVLGYAMKVASKEDILAGKIWAHSDPERDEIKRDKDLLDIKRLLRKFPDMERLIPKELKKELWVAV